jgi:muramoyltetrapeptide carboxypeptidase
MITPAYLNKGDKIGIAATARKIIEIEILPAVKKLEEWGLEVVTGKNLFKQYNQFAGTDEERTEDLQNLLDDSSIKAIICARGGYGTVRIIDKLDFTKFKNKPKWIVGYSDATVLHSHIHTNFGIETLHAVMPFNREFWEDNSGMSLESLRKALFGEKLSYNISASQLSIQGESSGILTGGNLSILYSLCGSNSDINTEGKILFVEDIDEYLYHIDRMMMNLKRTGKLSKVAGLIVGGMSEMKDNTVPYGKTAEEIILETVKDYDYPVCFGFPAGHTNQNYALILGKEVKLTIKNLTATLNFEL